jgi:antitoxin component of MazEF toxin-antitoxin module
MTTNIRAWGNSQGIYIPKALLKEALLEVNDSVEISVENGALVIRKDTSSDNRRKAWEALKAIRNAHSSDNAERITDYRKEYEEYLDERYGF